MVSHKWGTEHLTKFATYLLPCLTVNHFSVQFQALSISVSVWEIKLKFSQIRSWTLAIPRSRKNGVGFLFFDNWYVVLWHFFFKIKKIINNELPSCPAPPPRHLSCWEMSKPAHIKYVFECFVFWPEIKALICAQTKKTKQLRASLARVPLRFF